MDKKGIDTTALHNIGYGLYVLTVNDGAKDNGLIVNTVMQLTSNPVKLGVAVNKSNYSHDVIKNSGIMNINCLTESAPFKVFEVFGFQSGRDVDKMAGCTPKRAENGLAVLPHYINAWLSLRVESYTDLGSHGLFICTLTEAERVSDEPSMTYAYYHKNVKPKPATDKIEGYVCKICGYVHPGAELPEDFECPLCKHGREDFEPIRK